MLEVSGLSVRYGRGAAVRDVTLEVGAGTIVSLVGANGAGKTSLINAVSGLVTPASGRVCFEGRDIGHLRAYERVRLGIVQVPEGRQLFPRMSVRENLLMGAAHGQRAPEIEIGLTEAYRLFPRLLERIAQTAGSLSGGEQQMLAIARALMSRPRLLMLDEPSLGLAPVIVKEIFRIVRQLNERGITVLLVEQNIRMSLRVSDVAYIIENGRIVTHGPAALLLADARTQKAYFGLS